MTLEQQFNAYQQVFHNCGGQLALMEVEAEIHLYCESCGQSAKEVRFVSKGINAKVFFKEVEYQTIKPGAITQFLEEEYTKLPQIAKDWHDSPKPLIHEGCGGDTTLNGNILECRKCNARSGKVVFKGNTVSFENDPSIKKHPQFLDAPIFIDKHSEWEEYDDIRSLVGDLTHTCGGDVRPQGRVFVCNKCDKSAEYGFDISPLGVCNF